MLSVTLENLKKTSLNRYKSTSSPLLAVEAITRPLFAIPFPPLISSAALCPLLLFLSQMKGHPANRENRQSGLIDCLLNQFCYAVLFGCVFFPLCPFSPLINVDFNLIF